MRELITVQSQDLWKEQLQRETTARVAWNLKYGHMYLKEGRVPRRQPQQTQPSSALGTCLGPAVSSPPSKKVRSRWPDIKGAQSQLSMEVGGRDPQQKRHRAREAQRATQGPVGQTRSEGLVMRPAPPSTLKLLFQGISHDGQGRAKYLRERYRQKPQEKFQYPILSSWEYGWHLEDSMKDIKAPTYGKSQPITKIFYLKSGVFPPPYA